MSFVEVTGVCVRTFYIRSVNISSPLPVFANKDLLEHSQAHRLFTYGLWVPLHYQGELSSCWSLLCTPAALAYLISIYYSFDCSLLSSPRELLLLTLVWMELIYCLRPGKSRSSLPWPQIFRSGVGPKNFMENSGKKNLFFVEVSELLRCKSRASKSQHGNDLPVVEDKEKWRRNEVRS